MPIDSEQMTKGLIRLAENQMHAALIQDDDGGLSEAQKVFKAIWLLEAEANNGGLNQYFFNSSGRTAPYVVSALTRIGAPETAAIVQEAIGLMGDEVSWLNDAERQEAMLGMEPEIEDSLEKLTAKILGYPNDLTALLYRYVAQHRTELGAPVDF